MAAFTLSQLVSPGQTNIRYDFGSCTPVRNYQLKLLFKRYGFNNVSSLGRTGCWPLQTTFNQTSLTSSESTLIIVRHGESMWNEKNLFTGCVDVPLTRKGVEEAIEAGKKISTIPFDIVYTSALVRSQMTAMLALTQHSCQKVPIIIHNENEEAKIWNQIYSEDTKNHSIPVVKAWQLNERMYGDLQGLNKQETAEVFGKEQVYKWRRSYEVRPPNGESLEMCLQRAVSYFKDNIEPQLKAGKHVMVVAHANSLRSIIMYLDNLTPQEVINLELSTGVPMLYIYKDGKFIRRGSPAGPHEAGVYAYTSVLTLNLIYLKFLIFAFLFLDICTIYIGLFIVLLVKLGMLFGLVSNLGIILSKRTVKDLKWNFAFLLF